MFTPDMIETFHFLHCFTALGFSVYFLIQYITGKFPAAFSSKQTLTLFIYMFFHGLFLLLRLYLLSGASYPNLELYRMLCSFIAHIALAGTAISLFGYHYLRILIYCGTSLLLTIGAYIFTGNILLFALIFLVIPANILIATAMQHLAMESTDKKDRRIFFRMGLLHVLYTIIQLPLYLRYLPAVQNKANILHALIPLFCLLSILTLNLIFINYYCLTHPRLLPEKRKKRFVVYGIIIIFILISVSSNTFSTSDIRAYAVLNNQKLEILQNSMKRRIKMLAASMECIQMEDEKFFSSVDANSPRKELYQSLSMSPFILDRSGICTHSLQKEWIGKNFTKDLLSTPIENNQILAIYLDNNNRTGTKGIFLIAPRIKDKKGTVCIKLDFPRFEFFPKFNDDCFLVSQNAEVVIDRNGTFSGLRFAGVTADCLTLIGKDGKTVKLPAAYPEYDNKTYVFTTMKDLPFLDNSILILGVDGTAFFSFCRFTLPVTLHLWLLCLLIFAFWQIKKAFREKNDLIKLYHDNFCLSSGVPTIIFDEQGIITDANCYAEDLFHVTEGALKGKKFTSIARSAETNSIDDCIQKMYSDSMKELITGYACLPGGEKFCVFIFLLVPPHISGDRKLCACRFMVRNDAAKVDPVPAGAWMSFCKHSKDPVFLLSPDGRIISSNLAGRTAVVPLTLDDILTPENAHIFRSMTENVMLSGQVFNFEAVIPAKENVPRYYDILFFPVYTVTGQQHKPVAVGVVARNITNLRQSEKVVRDLQQMIREQQTSS